MTKPFATLIKEELAWMKEAERDWGEVLIDPYTIALNSENPALQRIFKESGLNKKNPDHWKLLLARLAAVVYLPRKAGPGRPLEWSPQRKLELLNAALECRRRNPDMPVVEIGNWLSHHDTRFNALTAEYLRDIIQRMLTEARSKLESKFAEIKNHQDYVLGAKGALLRDFVWAFSSQGKAELKARKTRLGS
jgi:hypothetical protein